MRRQLYERPRPHHQWGWGWYPGTQRCILHAAQRERSQCPTVSLCEDAVKVENARLALNFGDDADVGAACRRQDLQELVSGMGKRDA